MFCFQCQETLNNKGCTVQGVCGKTDDVATLQDLLIYLLKGISIWGLKAREMGIFDRETGMFVAEGLFTTITNVNFDVDRVREMIERAIEVRENIKDKFLKKYGKDVGDLHDSAFWKPSGGLSSMLEKGKEVGVLSTRDDDIRSLRELLVCGLKGIAAYTGHAYILKHFKDDILYFIEEALVATTDDSKGVDGLVRYVMEAGRYAVESMKLLDEANTSSYGHPEVTYVYTGTYPKPGILVSGHDLLDLEELLKQTEGTGINVYTHGEMLPANAYPGLKKYSHLVGNYGGSWHRQQKEFAEFNGPIVMTTNCIQRPLNSYKDRIFTTGLVAWPGVAHIPNRVDGKPKDFSPVIKKALELGSLKEVKGKKIPIGFAHNTLFGVLDKVIEATKSGKMKRFFVMSGCDGRYKEREYYTEFAKLLPKDTVILTSGCAKYRYNMLDLGDVDGIPRVLDAGQCNDSYSLILTALKLKEVLGANDVNDLPISYNIAWYEQKAVAVLLGLLYSGVKKVRLGPTLPAFISPNVLKVLVEKFDIRPITTVEKDMKDMLEGR